jgi:TonB-linked SusC/RagA family outer membrane protein
MNSKREFKWRAFAEKTNKFMRVCAFLLVCSLSMTAFAQTSIKVTGTVTDPSGETLIGASVAEKGTTNGTVTDLDGNFSLTASPGATLEITYIGYLTATVKVAAGKTDYSITLSEDRQSLDEVVVVGYGVQKKKLVTGATVQVSGEKIQKMSTTSALTAMQSLSPGVAITQNNGQPGSGFIVNIRGIGTIGNSAPLYVIDGVAGGDINHISPSDIESIDILKDAASAAIYGARAANGVVLVTTKQGKVGKNVISYDGYVGWQYMTKKPDLLNAKEYISVQNERRFNEGLAAYDWENDLPAGMYQDIMDGKEKGTDWVDAFYKPGAPTTNHSFNLTGGNDVSTHSLGYSYTSQDGILGEAVQSTYKRHTFRINSDHVLLKVKDFDAIKIGETLNYMYRTNSGISNGNQFWNAFYSVLVANPLLPAYDKEGDYYDYYDKAENGWNFDGNTGNPIAAVTHSSQGLNLSKNHALNASAYLQLQPIKNLIFKSQFGYRMSASSYRDNNRKIRLSNNGWTENESISQNQSVGYNWTIDNTVSYNWKTDIHNLTLMAGQSAEKWGYGENVSSYGRGNLFDLGWDYAWVDNVGEAAKNTNANTGGGNPWGQGSLASFFGRVSYDYKETYMLTAIMRADGHSNFASGKRWGYFPSVSAGWVVTNEPFMAPTQNVLDFLKIRASFGQNGNANINAFQYLSTYEYSSTSLYYFGSGKDVGTTGAIPRVLKNPDVTWETQEMLDLAFDARLFNQRLGVTFDWYSRTTKGWLVEAPISGVWGFRPPYKNGGAIKNSGFEVSLDWNDKIGDVGYGVNLNYSNNTNEVTEIANSEGIIHGPTNVVQGTSEFYRTEVGHPVWYFYGYKSGGIFQNADQVQAYKNSQGIVIQPNAIPGDVIFVDVNDDGKIDDNDKGQIGSQIPKHRLGFSLSLDYKGFDLMVAAAGAFGHQIFKSYRSFADSPLQNYTTDVYNRWYGEGTSNKWPRLTSGSNANYQQISDIWLEDGDYLKIQNITLGYNFKHLSSKIPFKQARLYLTGQNLFTFTKYSGMDPEIGFGNDTNNMSGLDLGYYPSAKTYLVGINLTF